MDPRGGKAHWGAVGRRLRGRAEAHLGRPVAVSWEESASSPPTKEGVCTRRQVASTPEREWEQRHARVTKLVAHGAISKACAMLTFSGVQDASDPLILNDSRNSTPLRFLRPRSCAYLGQSAPVRSIGRGDTKASGTATSSHLLLSPGLCPCSLRSPPGAPQGHGGRWS